MKPQCIICNKNAAKQLSAKDRIPKFCTQKCAAIYGIVQSGNNFQEWCPICDAWTVQGHPDKHINKEIKKKTRRKAGRTRQK